VSKAPAHGKVKLSPKAYIIHDASGTIISVGRVPLKSKVRIEVKPRDQAHSVLEVELNAEQAAMSPLDLHKGHKVHVGQKKLVKT
jgi:hypothetical protein